MSESDPTPSVLFVCVKNGGESQMAAGLMRKIAAIIAHVSTVVDEPTAFAPCWPLDKRAHCGGCAQRFFRSSTARARRLMMTRSPPS